MVPHIIDSPDDVRRIHERRDKERLEFIERETNFKRRELPRNVNYRKKAACWRPSTRRPAAWSRRS
jgi:general secretion pathway protein D